MSLVTRRKFIALTALGGAAAYVSVACGGDDDSDAAITPDTTGQATTASTATVDAGTDNGAVGLRWFGQSMFLLTSPGGTTVLLDPFNDIGYMVPAPLNADVATITHEHPDHNNDALGGATATVLRGLTADGWAEIDETVEDVRIRTVQTFHDNAQGSMFGRNALFVFETGGLTIAHAGDLGHVLDDTQLAALGAVDVLMVPTGGGFSVGPTEATEVTTQVAPKMVFPMHYQTANMPSLSQPVDQFLEGKTVERVGSTDIRIARDALPEALTAYVLDYE